MPAPVAYLTILKHRIYSLDQIRFQIEILSESFEGDVWVTGRADSEERIGRFTTHIVAPGKGEGGVAYFRRLHSLIIRRAEQVAATHDGPKAVISYDPFRDGVLAILLRRRVGWPIVIEINGVYGSPHNFLHEEGWFNRTLKPLLLKVFGRATIAAADGIRLLYHNQLAGFARLPPRAVVRHYFDNVPLERFQPGPEEPILLHVGYPYYRKGIDILLAAFAQVRDEFPAWRLVLIGHQLIDHVPVVPPRVEILPGMSNEEVAGWIARCGCFVLASRSEGMGRVLIESAAAGKARIGSRVDGIYTVLEDEMDGLMFNSEDPDDLARQLRRVMSSPALRTTLGATARRRALAEFSSDRYVRHVAEMVRSVIALRATKARH